MAQYGFHVNIDNCVACRACEGACKQEFELPVGVRRRRVLVENGDIGGVPWRRHISLACNHCAEPGCLRACPVTRYWKDEDPGVYSQPGTDVAALRAFFGFTAGYSGLVLIKPTVAESATVGVDCIGCKRCMSACPYGAPQWDAESERMDKCSGCFHRWKTTANDPVSGTSSLPAARRKPACVLSCTALALSFGDMSLLSATKTSNATDWAQARVGDPVIATTWVADPNPAGTKEVSDPSLTTPSVRFTPQRNLL